MAARGIRNNNPLNIRRSKDRFKGEVQSTDKSFKQFESMEYGYRAAFVIIGTYISKGVNTLEKIIERWAPSTENHTGLYIDFVEKRSKVDRNCRLTSKSGLAIFKIVEAMMEYETGEKPNYDQVKGGFLMQDKITV